MTHTEQQALIKERAQILAAIREAVVMAHCAMSCFRNTDGAAAHPMIERLDQINQSLKGTKS
jgi:triphosphoribosyl-dephospho-CoA synthetase